MDKTKHIKAGILIPTCNRLNFLKLSLQTAIKQSHENTNIIVIDNGPTDETGKYIREIDDSRVTYVVNEKNIGLIGSINKGIRLMSDDIEWCTVLCDDDLLHKNFLESVLLTAIENSAKSIVHCHRIFINGLGEKTGDAHPAPPEESAADYVLNRMKVIRETYLTGVFFRRDAFFAIGGYPDFKTGMASDDAFIFALSLIDRLVYDPNTTASIRIHEHAESQTFTNMSLLLDTLIEFEIYCEKAAGGSGKLTPGQLHNLKKWIRKYVVNMGSSWWIRNLHKSIQDKDSNYFNYMKELCSIAKRYPDHLSFRIHFDAFFFNTFHWCPEENAAYRKAWTALIETYKYALKTLYISKSKTP